MVVVNHANGSKTLTRNPAANKILKVLREGGSLCDKDAVQPGWGVLRDKKGKKVFNVGKMVIEQMIAAGVLFHHPRIENDDMPSYDSWQLHPPLTPSTDLHKSEADKVFDQVTTPAPITVEDIEKVIQADSKLKFQDGVLDHLQWYEDFHEFVTGIGGPDRLKSIVLAMHELKSKLERTFQPERPAG